jgi:hypothetical protein
MFRRQAAIVLLAGLCLTPHLASAQTPRGPEIRVDQQTLPSNWFPHTAVAPNGDFVVVWESGHPFLAADSPRVWFRLFRADGTPKGGQLRVSNGKARETLPSISMADDGSFVIVWQSGTTTDTSVFGRRFTAQGTPIGGRFLLSSSTEGNQSEPSVAVTPGGGFVAAWTSGLFPHGSRHSDVYARRFDANGQPLGPDFRVNSGNLREQSLPQVVVDGSGGFLVGWRSFGGEDLFFDIFAQRYAADGTTEGNEFQINAADTENTSQAEFSLAMADDGSFVGVWAEPGPDTSSPTGLRAQRFAADNTRIGPPIPVNSTHGAINDEPAVTMTPLGFFVAWRSYVTGPSPVTPRILGRRFFADGTPRGGDVRLDLSSGAKGQPGLAMSASGKGAVVWVSGLSGEQGVYARRIVQPLP